jgi:hypothetical protein
MKTKLNAMISFCAHGRKRARYFTIISFMTALTACSMQMSESVYDKNAGFNGSFEQVKDGLPVNWLFYTEQTTGSGSFTISTDQHEVKDGKQSLRFSIVKCSDKGGRYSPGLSKEIPVNAGEHYKISFWVKNEGTDFYAKVNAINATEQAEGKTFHSNDNDKEWQLYECDYTIPVSMNKLRIEMNMMKPGTCWVDDIKMEKM